MNDTHISLPSPQPDAVADAGAIRTGAVFRLPQPTPDEVADTGRIRLGAVFRLA